MSLWQRLLHATVGLTPPRRPEPWIEALRAEGYYVTGDEAHGWKWHLPYRGFSCAHTTERSAWADAEQHHEQRVNNFTKGSQ